jgi:hypothetical protein
MKKIICYILVLTLFFSIGLSLDCQYTEYTTKNVEVLKLVDDDTKEVWGDPLIFSDFTSSSGGSVSSACIASFKIVNPNNKDINGTVKFLYKWGKLMGPAEKYVDYPVYIASNEAFVIKYDVSSCHKYANIDPESISYLLYDNIKPVLKYENLPVEVCSTCNGKVCLNDGVISDSDEKCGSGKRNILNICIPKGEDSFIIGDNISSTELGENCANSPSDVKCGNFSVCIDSGVCIDDCDNPPAGKSCCAGKFKEIKKQQPNFECGCNFECVDHYSCKTNLCKPDPSAPPSNMYYHKLTDGFRTYSAINLGCNCKDDLDCSVGVCYQNKCQKLMEPKLRCPTGTYIKRGEDLLCNIYASNILLGKDVQVTFILEAGSGLSFSQSEGCSNIVGSQCIGTYDVASLSNKGINVGLNTLSAGDMNITGNVKFNYKNKVITENVAADFSKIHIYDCGDGKVNVEETKFNCCADVGVKEYTWYHLRNEECSSDGFFYVYNGTLILILVLIFVLGAIFLVRELTKLSEAKQKEIAKSIAKIDKEIIKKKKSIEMDQQLIKKLEQEKEKEEELKIVKERIKDSTEEIKELRTKEHKEKKKLKEGRLKPFTNKQGHPVIINDHGYEQFAESLKYPGQAGEVFHRWYARKNIYYKNRGRYRLHFSEYEVHHKDSNKRNNDLSNLDLLTREEHRRVHNL